MDDALTTRCARLSAVLVMAAALLAGATTLPAVAQDDLRAQAEEAWRQERHADAIDLYRRIVEQSPDDAFSKKRLALLLSWNDRLDESIALYREILKANPQDEEAKRELAKVLAWEGQYGESEALLDELLRARPDDPDLLLRRAEVLSWHGKYVESRRGYLVLISRNERVADASLGLGNLSLWEGDLPGAEKWYARALAADHADTRARVGIARSWHARGLTREALSELDLVPPGSTGAREASRLREQIAVDTRTSASISFAPYSDTDDNDLDTWRASGTLFVDPQSIVTATYFRYEADSNCAFTALCDPGGPLAPGQRFGNHADRILGSYRGRISRGVSVGGRLGAVRRSFFEGGSSTDLEGAAEVTLYPDVDLSYGFAYSVEPILATAPLIENGIRFDTLSGSASYAFAELWQLRGEISHSWVNDDNGRNAAFGSVGVRLPFGHPRTHIVFSSRALAYDENPETGYFSPELLWTNLITATVADETRQRRFYYAADLSFGFQEIKLNPEGLAPGDDGNRGTDRVFGWNLLAGVNFSDHLSLEASYGESDMAQQTATGFEYRQGFLQLRAEW